MAESEASGGSSGEKPFQSKLDIVSLPQFLPAECEAPQAPTCGASSQPPAASRDEIIAEALTSAAELHAKLVEALHDAIAGWINEAIDCYNAGSQSVQGAALVAIDDGRAALDSLCQSVTRVCAGRLAECQELIGQLERTAPEAPPEAPPPPPPPTGPIDQPPPTSPPQPSQRPETSQPQPPPPKPPAKTVKPLEALTSAGIICRPDLYALPDFALDKALPALSGIAGRGAGGAAFNALLAPALAWESAGKLPIVGDLLKDLPQNIAAAIEEIGRTLANLAGCGVSVGPLLGLTAVIDALSMVAPSLKSRLAPAYYAQNLACPVEFPTPAEADGAYLANEISEDILKSWVKIHNQCWEPHKSVLDAKRSKLTTGELLRLLLKGDISQQEFSDGVRELGFIRTSDAPRLLKLAEFVLPYTDIVRLMVRDAFDDDAAKRLGMDELFYEKFSKSEDAKRRAKALGLAENDMKLLWRAHWDLPAPGQLFEQVHRLPAVDDATITMANTALAAAGSSFRMKRQTAQEVLNDNVKTLVQKDILPSQIPGLLALTFRPLRIRDASRAYEIGAISREQLKAVYKEIGYTEANAEILAQFWTKEKARKVSQHSAVKLFAAETIDRAEAERRLRAESYDGETIKRALDDAAATMRDSLPVKLFERGTIDREAAARRLEALGLVAAAYNPWLDDAARKRPPPAALKEYKLGLLSRRLAKERLEREGMPADRADKLLAEVEAARRADTAKFCARHIRKRFLTGEIDAGRARMLLSGQGLAEEAVEQWLRRFECERASMGRQPPTAMLCRWFAAGMIAPADMTRRLVAVGWPAADAARIVQDCVQRTNDKRADDQAKQAKNAAKAIEKGLKEQARTRKASESQLAALERARQKRAAAAERLEKRIIAAADKLAARLGIGTDDAAALARRHMRAAFADFGLSPQERVAALEQAVKGWPADSGQLFAERFREVVEAFNQNGSLA